MENIPPCPRYPGVLIPRISSACMLVSYQDLPRGGEGYVLTSAYLPYQHLFVGSKQQHGVCSNKVNRYAHGSNPSSNRNNDHNERFISTEEPFRVGVC